MSKPYKTCSRCGANLDPDEKCDCIKPTSFNIVHYGKLIDDYETVVSGNHVRQKIYLFDNVHYIETWCNGNRLLLSQLI